MGSYSGRPKEEGGHKPLKISVNKFTDDVLQEVGNKSKFIEHSIQRCMQSKWMRFCEPNETINNYQCTFKGVATFVWTPNDATNNAILSTRCFFQYRCTGEGFRFRMVINEESSSWVIVGSTGTNYTWSRVYADHDFGFHEGVKTFPNQSSYTIKFQFEPLSSSGTAYVKDINVLLEVVDSMPAVSP